jgi:hypothetical protein
MPRCSQSFPPTAAAASWRPRLWLTLAARARRLLTYIEEQGLIVCQLDGTGRRTVKLVELAWATAPGDPNAGEAEQGRLAV